MQRERILRIFAVILLLGLLCLTPGNIQQVKANNIPLGDHIVYNMYSTDGYITLADGKLLYIYGFVGGRDNVPLKFLNSTKALINPGLPNIDFSGGSPAPTAGPITVQEAKLAGNAQFPAPVIYAKVGDVVEIRLKNLGTTNKKAPNDPHSIHLHGLDVDAANDGVPETSVGAVPANSALPGAGNVVVYMFKADKAGTYMYHCHQEASIHVAMGMYGALVIYEPGDAAAAGGPGTGSGSLYGWQYDKDVIMLLSDSDTRQNLAEESARVFNNILYQPQYWFINGLSFPNTIHAGLAGFNWTNWIETHPGYDPFIVGSISKPSIAGTPGEKVLLRVINMGFQAHPMHMHGFHGKIIGSDARGWSWANTSGVTPFGEGLEKNTLNIGSGETYDWLLDLGQQANAIPSYAPNATDHATGLTLDQLVADAEAFIVRTFSGGTHSKVITPSTLPVSNTDTSVAGIPDPFNPGKTYIPGPAVSGFDGGMDTNSDGPGQYFPFHNHEDYKATNNGVYPGGMFTMIKTLP